MRRPVSKIKRSNSSDKRSKQQRAAMIRRRIKALLHNECVMCEYKLCLRALELHHVDPRKKSFNVSMCVLRYKWETLVKELLKCVLVCNRCHAELEDGIKILKETDIPKQYYTNLLNSLKSPKDRLKSKSYTSRRKTASKQRKRTPRRKKR